MPMAADVSLLDALAGGLPKDLQLRVYHLSTRPTAVPALYSAAAGQSEQKTFCENHILSLALPALDRPHELLVFAVEVLIFTTHTLTTIFVSKADTTGFLHLLKLGKCTGSVVKTLSTTFLRYLVSSRLEGPRVVLSLFARSQNQYLFPGSVEYAGKHVLDDRQLIRWWCQVLDPIIADPGAGTRQSSLHTTAYVLVPGCDKTETRAFFPRSARLQPPQSSRWHTAYPVELLAPNSSAPLRCLIPRLPDDPKSRFLTDLDDSKNEKGQWRSVKSMDQFWELMSYRQECSAGRLVGFIWVVFAKRQETSTDTVLHGHSRGLQERQSVSNPTVPPTPENSEHADSNIVREPSIAKASLEETVLPGSPLPLSPVLPAHEPGAREVGDPNIKVADQYDHEVQTQPVAWPEATSGEVVIDSEQYDVLIEHLLQLDFSTRPDAEKATRSFIAKASNIAGQSWGKSITGLKPIIASTVAASGSTDAASVPTENGINVLTAVRKKRKMDVVNDKSPTPEPAVNTLATGLFRKKAKS